MRPSVVHSGAMTSEAVTRNVRVRVTSAYLEQESRHHPGQNIFAYHVTITNETDEPVQLLGRHWTITDGYGQVREVKGSGVVGQQPTIPSGESHQYSSFCPLPTPIGTMRGTYQMVTGEGQAFDVEIAPFTLAVPGARN